ncbi:NEAT domain-containing protein [Leuconostoc suionicum]|uniref:NEAT domain-containing protein n=1 Tax=Leuconostoc suionicum TaxID=1511761 RepID=UPI004036705A
MEKNKVLVLAGTLAISGTILLNSDVANAADTTSATSIATTATSSYQNGTYTATATLYKSGTATASTMGNMVNSKADVTIKNQTAIVTLTFGQSSNSDMVKAWTIDGVEATKNGQTFSFTIPVSDLNKTLKSTVRIEAVLPGGMSFTETQPVDLKLNDLTLVARDPEEVAAEEAAKKAADEAAATKAAQEAADKKAADEAAVAKAAQEAADKKVADEANKGTTAQYSVNLYKAGTTESSMMTSMVSPTTTVVTKDNKATVTLNFNDATTIDMVKSWTIDGIAATKSGKSFVVVLPASDLGKTLHSVISISTTVAGQPFSETQSVDMLLKEKDNTTGTGTGTGTSSQGSKLQTSNTGDQPATPANTSQTKTSQYSVKIYKTGTKDPSMMTSMVSPIATVVIKNGQATVTLTFKDMATIDMVKSWVIDGVTATKSGQNFVVVLPASDLGKTLHSVISVSTTIGGVPFSETQSVDILLQADASNSDTYSNTGNSAQSSSTQTIGHDVPLTDRLSSTTKLPKTATENSTVALLVAGLSSGILAVSVWFKKVLR